MNFLSAFEHAWLTPQNVLEAMSAALGVAGAYLLAIKSPWAGWAFVLWLFSSLGWVAFGWLNGHWFLVVQNTAFAITNLIGIWTWRVFEALGGPDNDGLGDDS